MKKILLGKFLLVILLSVPAVAVAQSPCGPPTPGAPHVCLTWLASTTSGVTYNIYRATTAGTENYGAPLNSAPLTALFFYDKTVAIGSNYFYTVTAVGSGGAQSAPTAEVSAQIPVPPSSPTTPAASID